MGKYAATRAFQRDRRQADGLHSTFDYLLEVPNEESQFRLQSFIYGADPTGLYRGYLDQRDAANYWNAYFHLTGLTWSDIKYPTRMYGFGLEGRTASTGVNFFSKNISRLYR